MEVLIRVLPLGSTHDLETRTFTLISAELYEEGVIIRYQVADKHFDPSEDAGFGEPTSLTLSGNIVLALDDDVGTTYRNSPGGGGGIMRYERRFSPRIPQHAQRLKISIFETETMPIEKALRAAVPDEPLAVLDLDL